MEELSSEQIEQISSTWAIVSADEEESGQAFFSYLFTSYPEFQKKHFPKMMNSKFLTIRKLRLHGARVIREIGVMVEHVKAGNDEDLMDKIKQITINHGVMRDIVSIEPYRIVLDGLVSFLQTTLGDSLNETGYHAWKKLVNNIIAGVDQELEILKADMENEED